MPVFNDINIELDIDEIEQLNGLTCKESLPPRVKSLLPEIIVEIDNDDLIHAAISYEIVEISAVTSTQIAVQGGTAIEAPVVVHKLDKASHLAVGAATIGNTMGATIKEWFSNGRQVKAILLEEIANTLLYKLSNRIQTLVETQATGMGLEVSGPLAPGNFGFGISQQAPVLDLARADKIGISLTSMALMDPVHSISVVIGLGNNMRKWSQLENCETCNSRDKCTQRLNIQANEEPKRH